MQTVTVYGASDDLIEIEGDIRDEISADSDMPCKLAFSDGTVLNVVYDEDGCWRVTRIAAGTAAMQKIEAEGSDTDNYSDRVTLNGDIKWVVAGYCITKVEPTSGVAEMEARP